jgi:hypothetical protein
MTIAYKSTNPVVYVFNWVVGGRAPLPFWQVQKGGEAMRTYEVITIVLTIIKLIIELVKLCIEHKKSRPDRSK